MLFEREMCIDETETDNNSLVELGDFAMGPTARFRNAVLLILLSAASSLCALGVFRSKDWNGLWMSIGTNLLSTAFTYYLLDRLIGERERREIEERESRTQKDKLIAAMSSRINSIALEAVEGLRHRGWLYDGSLRGVDLFAAHLEGANLDRADLANANLSDANLQGTTFTRADLHGAQFRGADLRRAVIREGNLQGASLVSCKLQGSDLRRANLQDSELLLADLTEATLTAAVLKGANLSHARVVGTDFNGAVLDQAKVADVVADETTILSDGTKWSREVGLIIR